MRQLTLGQIRAVLQFIDIAQSVTADTPELAAAVVKLKEGLHHRAEHARRRNRKRNERELENETTSDVGQTPTAGV